MGITTIEQYFFQFLSTKTIDFNFIVRLSEFVKPKACVIYSTYYSLFLKWQHDNDITLNPLICNLQSHEKINFMRNKGPNHSLNLIQEVPN